jgi:hypothetical protein
MTANALMAMGRVGGADAALGVLQHAAALAEYLHHSKHQPQKWAMFVLAECCDALSADRAVQCSAVQQVARQPRLVQHVVRLLDSNLNHTDEIAVMTVKYAVQLLSCLVVCDSDAAKQVLAMPAVVPALVRLLDSKEAATSRQAAAALASLPGGALLSTGWRLQ